MLQDEETKEEEKVPIKSIYNHFNNHWSTNPSIYSLLVYLQSGETCLQENREQCQGAPCSSSRNLEQEDGRPRGGRGGAKEENHLRLPQVMENVVVAGS